MSSSIPGKGIDGALRLARLPVDRLLKLAPDMSATTAVGLAIDRADATIRGAAGSILKDEGLRNDAERRREAADTRKRAMQLRAKSRKRVDDAAARTDRVQAESAARRERADKQAERKRAQAAGERERLKEQAAKTAKRRKQAAQKKAERNEDVTDKRSKVERLEQLDKKADALEVKDAAVRAADEARRLEEAAAATKAKRKVS